MSSPGQKRGSCGHAMAIFDGHAFCARCREKGKGEEPCVKDKDSVDCSLCNSFTSEQRVQISTPSYKIKKEKREAKRADITQPTDELIDPSSISVIGVVGGPSTDKSPVPPEKKTKKDKPSVKPKKSATATLSSATEDKLTALEDKWSDRFNRLEALLLAKSMEPAFSSDVRVAPTHSAPSNVTWDSEPFLQPPNPSDDAFQRTGPDSSAALQPSAGKLVRDSSLLGSSSSERTGPDNVASQQKSAGKLKVKSTSQGRTGPDTASQKHKSTGKPSADCHRPTTALPEISKQPVTDHPSSDRPLGSTGSASPTLQKSRKDSISSLDSDSQISDTPPVELFAEEGDFSEDPDFEQELPTSEEQTYRETMRGIRSFMGWSHIPDMDSSNPSDDNPFAGPKAPLPSKVSVQMPTEDYLCRKLSKLNLTMTEGYPSRTTEAGSLPMDHFLRPPKPQTKWYGLYSDQQLDPATVTSWNTGPSKLNNSSPLHIATLFAESVVKKAEEEIALYDSKSHPAPNTTSRAKNRYHPYEKSDRKQEGRSEGKQDRPAWKNINRRQFKRGRGKASSFSSRPARGQQQYK